MRANDIIAMSLCRCSVLACLAYVNLGLGDPLPALSYARQLLGMPKLLGGLKFLGQVYAAEALVQLGCMPEALQHLNAESVTDKRKLLGHVPRCAGAWLRPCAKVNLRTCLQLHLEYATNPASTCMQFQTGRHH